MAEFALAGDEGGHSWNNALAHATYAENVATLGEETARQYLRADIRSWIQEQKGQESQWSLTLRDGKMMTETGVSLDEMTANITQGRYSSLVPENIKATAPLEAATLREATRLAVEGAEKIILPEQHLDQDGNIVSRYLSVWTKNASDPTRYDGSRIDLGKNIRIEDVRTGTSFTAFEQQDSVSFHQHAHQKQAFVLAIQSNANNSFAEIKNAMVTKIHRSHQETYSRLPEEVPQERQQKQASTQENYRQDMLTDISSRVLHDTRETVRDVAVYLRSKKIQREMHGEGVVKRANVLEGRRGQPSERITLAKIREKPVSVVELTAKRHVQMQRDARALSVIAETGLAMHAAPVLLARIAEQLPTPVRAVEKSIARHAKKELRRKNKELRKAKREVKKNRLASQEVVLRSWETKELKARRKRLKLHLEVTAEGRIFTFNDRDKRKRKERRKMNMEKGIKKVAAAELLTPIILEKREKQQIRKLYQMIRRAERTLDRMRMPRREKIVWVKLAVADTEFAKFASQGSASRSEKEKRVLRKPGFRRAKPGFAEDVRLQERMVFVGVRFAWMVWMILGRKEAGTSKSTFIRHRLASQDDVLQDKEETPWVLLSIIHYLTALREQGAQNTTNTTNTTNRQMKKRKNLLPQHAVIFAYAS
ncbi:MAG: hypothetical protein Q8L37_03665 [Candidatus Gottesmanbacteria bacterium]|nr:hypothetical protein [Candidatus Gottesmanbacteria bacterium]